MDLDFSLPDAIFLWHTVFELLSLERARAFWPEMGLSLADPHAERVQSVAHSFMEQYQNSKGGETEYRILLRQTFDQLAHATDQNTAQQLYQWGMYLFSPKGVAPGAAFIWGVLLRHLAGSESKRNDVLPVPLPEHKVNDIIQAVRDHLGDYLLLEQRVEDLGKLPRTESEQIVYQAYEEPCSPLDSLAGAIDHYRLRQTWHKIKSLLSDDEMKVLLEWGKSQARLLGMPDDLVSVPPYPVQDQDSHP